MMDKFLSLKKQCEEFGFEVTEGSFMLRDGLAHPVRLQPLDPEALVYAAARAYTDRRHVRAEREAEIAERDRLALAQMAERERHPTSLLRRDDER